MLSQHEAETGLVYSLLRKPGEDAEDSLFRVASLPIAIEAEDVADPSLRVLLANILENAGNDVATSTYLAAQATGIEEFDLVRGVETVDPGAIRIYAEAVAYHSARRQITSAAEGALETARNSEPSEALDEISEHFASISLASESSRINSVSERTEIGRVALAKRQEAIRSGEVRVSFPMDGLNEMVPYLLPGQMILITAATKVGKSAFAQQLFDANVKRGLRGIYFHFEDTPEVMDLRRVARQMFLLGNDGVSLRRMLSSVLSEREQERVEEIRQFILEWGNRGTEIYCAGWTMEQVVRVWHRLVIRGRTSGDPVHFVVIDYLNKAHLPPQKLKSYGLFAARGQDAETVKHTAEATETLAFLVQQENIQGNPYETNQSSQKSQVWISLARDRLDNYKLNPQGEIIVKNANLGSTGAVAAEFLPRWLLWREL